MGFVNEKISATDRERYDLEQIDKRFIVGGVKARHWTIDKERNSYLRIVNRGREESSHKSTWTFFWREELLIIKLEKVSSGGDRGGPGWSHRRIKELGLPPEMESSRSEVVADLRDAFTAYKDGGIYSSTTEYKATLEFD